MNAAQTLPVAGIPREPNGDWEREYIIYRFRKALGGRSFVAFAAGLGLNRGAVSDALRGRSHRMEREMATVIGVAPQEIWPSRYSERRDKKERRARERRARERRAAADRRKIRRVGLQG